MQSTVFSLNSCRIASNSEHSLVDLCVILFRSVPNTSRPELLSIITQSKRAVKGSVSFSVLVEEGVYIAGWFQ